MSKKILIIDDDTDICNLLSRYLIKNGYETETAFSSARAIEQLKTHTFDLILCDFRLGDSDGMKMLALFHEMGLTIPVIIITGYSDIKIAVNVIKAGAFDYVTKPLIPDEILLIVRKALGEAKSEGTNVRQETKSSRKSTKDNSNFLLAKSAQAKELYRQVDLVAPTNYSVIIYGESGSGKEAIAQSIHDRSERRNQPFVAMDCGAISKELAGSELFGHEKGSFTGALNTKIGHFELANGGTLFLDEIANLSYDIQVSMLRVIQERKLKRIGGNKEIDLDVRIVIASNEDLADAYRKGKFREDLFHRFNEYNIIVPPLRDRDKDIIPFAEFFLEKANAELNKNITGFSDEVKEAFLKYSWPGNIRELKNIVKRATLISTGDSITIDSIPTEIINSENHIHKTFHPAEVPAANQETFSGMPAQKNNLNLKEAALGAEFETIMTVLKKVQFNKSKAARLLNIDRKTLYNKMKHYNLLGEKDEAE